MKFVTVSYHFAARTFSYHFSTIVIVVVIVIIIIVTITIVIATNILLYAMNSFEGEKGKRVLSGLVARKEAIEDEVYENPRGQSKVVDDGCVLNQVRLCL